MPITFQAWVTMIGGILLVLGSIWVVLKILSKLTLHEEKQFIDDRAHRVVTVRFEGHNADLGAHGPLLAALHEKVNDTRETTISNSVKLDQLLEIALSGGQVHLRRSSDEQAGG